MSRAATTGQLGVASARPKKPRCEDCYFFKNMLCALEKKPCPTFRPWHPDGLRPPSQLAFVFRTQPRPETPGPILEAEQSQREPVAALGH
jgi:hypothetical protein